jgi:serine/threonine-protein kinase
MPRDDAKAIIGRKIAGKFAIESIIGAGAMGTVYKAKQIALDKAVAIKVMSRSPRTESGGTPPDGSDPSSSGDEMFAARFLREAKAASRIDHPNSLRVIDFGEEPDGLLYMAMEFLDGRDLFTVIRQDFPLPPARVISVLMQALAAIAVAHEMGVIHRDLKPENIMVMSGTDDEGNPKDVVKVCDFGIAKITARNDLGKSQTGGGPKLTTAGLIVGTPEYMSPEQGRGETLDARSDLYSIGVIMFQLLTGKLPFEAETALGVVLKHVTDEPPRPSSIVTSIDPRLEAICLKAMRKKREDRYQTAREMRADLRAFAESTSTPVGAITGQIIPHGDRPSFPTAATEMALDSGAIRTAANAASQRPRTQSKVTPLGTELDEIEIPRRRWAGLILAALLLGVTATILVLAAQKKKESAIPVSTAPSASAPAVDADDAGFDAGDVLAPLVSSAPHAHHPKPNAHASDGGLPELGTTSSATAPAGNYDPSNARVVVGGVTPRNTGNRDVRSVLDSEQFSECYRSGLKQDKITTRPAVVHSTLTLSTDDQGHISTAALSGGVIPKSTGTCIMQSMKGKVIGGVGDVGADVQLIFVPGERL